MYLATKQSPGWTNEDGTVVAPHTLYRYVDANNKGGCWYSTIERARRSWERRTQGPDGPGQSSAGPAGPARART